MLQTGPAKKVTIHLNEDTSAQRDFLYNEIFAFLYRHGVAGASLLRPQVGFGSHHQIHEAGDGPGAQNHLPVRIEFIDSPENVAKVMPALCELMSDGLIEAQDTIIHKVSARLESPV